MDANDVVLPDVHIYLDGLYPLPLLREVEREEHNKEVIFIDIHLGEMVRCEAVFYSELVEAEDLPQEPPVGTLLAAFCAGYVAPDEGPGIGQVVGQLCRVHLCPELARTVQDHHVDALGLSAFHSEPILLVAII
jgi:hypothetical protein